MTLTRQERHCSTSVPFDLGLGLTWLKTRLRLPTARLPASINAARCDTGLTSLCPCEMSSSYQYHQINPNQSSARRQQHSTTTATKTVTCATAHRSACYELVAAHSRSLRLIAFNINTRRKSPYTPAAGDLDLKPLGDPTQTLPHGLCFQQIS